MACACAVVFGVAATTLSSVLKENQTVASRWATGTSWVAACSPEFSSTDEGARVAIVDMTNVHRKCILIQLRFVSISGNRIGLQKVRSGGGR